MPVTFSLHVKNAFALLAFGIASVPAFGQKVIEAGIKPTELTFLSTDVHVGIGDARNRYGALLAFRPSTQQSGSAIPLFWNGAGSTYDRRCFNRLYTMYTAGLYYKRYIGGGSRTFIEGNAYYRNWSFSGKQASYNNVERAGTSFSGSRSENVDVYGMKALIGKTFYAGKATHSTRLYIDLYGGLGARHEQAVYETRNGTVGQLYYSYKRDEYQHVWPTPQFGVVMGMVHTKPVAAGEEIRK